MKPSSRHPHLKIVLAALAATFTTAIAMADVKLPAIISNHMVLQRGKPVPIWGWADPGEEVTATIAGQTKTTRAAANGAWKVQFKSLRAGGPHTLTVKGKNEIVVADVLVGEVWLGSGQSNMAQPAQEARDFATTKAASDQPMIRMFKVESGGATNALTDCKIGRAHV